MAESLRKLEMLDDIEREKQRLEESEKQKSSELSALQKDKDLFNMETEVCFLSVCYLEESSFYI